jgi:hypothetical protein
MRASMHKLVGALAIVPGLVFLHAAKFAADEHSAQSAHSLIANRQLLIAHSLHLLLQLMQQIQRFQRADAIQVGFLQPIDHLL